MSSMRKHLLYLITVMLCSLALDLSAAVVQIVDNGRVIVPTGPVQAIVTTSDGTITEKTFTYDPQLGGVNVNVSEPVESIFFPDYGTRYIYWNGFWVNDTGYYWYGNRWV